MAFGAGPVAADDLATVGSPTGSEQLGADQTVGARTRKRIGPRKRVFAEEVRVRDFGEADCCGRRWSGRVERDARIRAVVSVGVDEPRDRNISWLASGYRNLEEARIRADGSRQESFDESSRIIVGLMV